MKLTQIAILNDNYAWLLQDKTTTIIIDPGEAKPIITHLQQQQITPSAILLTHHHADHVAGVTELLAYYPKLIVYSSERIIDGNVTQCIKNNKQLIIGSLHINVLDLPGHTAQHVGYYCAPYLFCGDVLFSAGCGRVANQQYQPMYQSLMKIAMLPDNTLICCGHEYTLNNLEFALTILPTETKIKQYYEKVVQLRANNQPTVPTYLATEKEINLFLRCNQIAKNSLVQGELLSKEYNNELDCFRLLRSKKDSF